MNKIITIIVVLFICRIETLAQEEFLLTEKPGTFKTTYNITNGNGADYYGEKTDYTRLEIESSKKNNDRLIEIFRRVPVLSVNKGFDAIAYVNQDIMNTKFGYGMPNTLTFFLETWSMKKGKEVKWTVEPPQFRLELNKPQLFCSSGFNVSNNSSSSTRTNPDFIEEACDKATVALRELFFKPPGKQEIAPGIERYGDTYILYNPERPHFWVQVTIREVYRRIMDYWRFQPDNLTKESMLTETEKQFSQYTEAEKNGFAYRGGKDLINKLGSEKNDMPVMLPNPEYWNRSLPRYAIQFLTIEIPDDATIKQKIEKSWNNADGYYYVYKIFSELNINNLTEIIDK
jgi:hypothetical protein